MPEADCHQYGLRLDCRRSPINGDTLRIHTEEDVVTLLRTEVQKCKSIAAWARSVSLNRSVVSSALHQNKSISKSVIHALGLRTAVVDGAERVLTKGKILKLLGAEVASGGGQLAWARRNGINRSLLNEVLCKRSHPTARMIRALGLRLVVISD